MAVHMPGAGGVGLSTPTGRPRQHHTEASTCYQRPRRSARRIWPLSLKGLGVLVASRERSR